MENSTAGPMWPVPAKMQVHWKYCSKLPLGYVHKLQIKCKWFPWLSLASIPKTAHYVCKYSQIQQIWNLKLFWFQALWMRNAKCVLITAGRWWIDGALGLLSNPASPWISERLSWEIFLHKSLSHFFLWLAHVLWFFCVQLFFLPPMWQFQTPGPT